MCRLRSAATSTRCELRTVVTCMWPKDMHAYCLQKGLLRDLQGTPCSQAGCYSGCSGPFKDRVLGSVHEAWNTLDMDVSVRTCRYYCLHCRSKYMVTCGSPLFSKIGGGMASMTDNVVGMWLCVHDVDVTTACKMLGFNACGRTLLRDSQRNHGSGCHCKAIKDCFWGVARQ